MFHFGNDKSDRTGKPEESQQADKDRQQPENQEKTENQEKPREAKQTPPSDSAQKDDQKISTDTLKKILSASDDIVFNQIVVGEQLKLTTIFVDGLVNSKMIDDDVLKPLIQESVLKEAESEQQVLDLIMLGTVYHCQRKQRDRLDDCIRDLLSGSVLLVFDTSGIAVTFEIKGFEKRSITEPTNENVLKGSKESFIEVLRVNTALLRRRIASRDLIVEQLKLGMRTDTTLAIVYLKGIANSEVVKEVRNRLKKINIDGIVSAGEIETYLLDQRFSLFPQLLYTERVDRLCGNLLEGRVGVMIDGIPITYIVPVDISSLLQAPEDYSLHFFQSSIFRLLRNLAAFMSLILPSFYVAITSFHQEMIPTKLAVAIIESKKAVPFPTFIEVLLMLLAFEILLEAGLRLPKSIGQTVSIIGALVVGDAAITAKILSPGVVIVIATAGITGFVIPSQDLANSIRICRVLLVFCSMFGGLFGISVGLIAILYHLCTLEIFGCPYLSPFVGNEGKQMFHDTIIRVSWVRQKIRPQNIRPEDSVRQGD